MQTCCRVFSFLSRHEGTPAQPRKAVGLDVGNVDPFDGLPCVAGGTEMTRFGMLAAILAIQLCVENDSQLANFNTSNAIAKPIKTKSVACKNS